MMNRSKNMTRRDVFKTAAAPSLAALLVPGQIVSQPRNRAALVPGPMTLPVLSQPDQVFVFLGDSRGERSALSRTGSDWTGSRASGGVKIGFHRDADGATVSIASPSSPVQRLHLRWKFHSEENVLVLGDAWERSYGELGWRHLEAERAMPWYAVLTSKERTSGMGVQTGAASLAFWQVDVSGISLWLDVRNGGNGVLLGKRTLKAATIVQYIGAPEEDAFSVTQRLCRAMVKGTTVPAKRGSIAVDVLYGSNDWYYAYGKNTHDGILRDADLIGSLAPANTYKPFTVVDDGYQDPARFPSLPKLAEQIRSRGVLPGIWIRPLRAPQGATASLLLPDARGGTRSGGAPPAYDPTVPEALQAIKDVASEARAWGFDLIKHDFTTYELFAQWGSQMGASPSRGDWHFHDRTKTNAEIIGDLYRALRDACGQDRVILGCNTMGHLSVGLFDASRTGDDVSGKDWERTRRLGVNTLAFRLPQHKTFYAIDADCVPVTPDVPWSMTRQWLQVVANSGSVLLISPDPKAVGAEQKQAIRDAFAQCVQAPISKPLDWIETRTPAAWQISGTQDSYQWILPEGESPFPIGIQRGPE